jgi:hypothetical protein
MRYSRCKKWKNCLWPNRKTFVLIESGKCGSLEQGAEDDVMEPLIKQFSFFFSGAKTLLSTVLFFFFFQWLFQSIHDPGLLFSSVIIFRRRQDSLDEWSPLRKAATWTQDSTKRKNAYTPNIHALLEIRTHDPSVRASEGSSCPRLRGYCHRQHHSLAPSKYIYA